MLCKLCKKLTLELPFPLPLLDPEPLLDPLPLPFPPSLRWKSSASTISSTGLFILEEKDEKRKVEGEWCVSCEVSERTSKGTFCCCSYQNLSTSLLLLRSVGVYRWNECMGAQICKIWHKNKKDFAPAGARCQRSEVLLRRQPGRRERGRISQWCQKWWQVSYFQQSWCVYEFDVAIWVRFASREAVKKEEWPVGLIDSFLASLEAGLARRSGGLYNFGRRFFNVPASWCDMSFNELERSWILRMRLAAPRGSTCLLALLLKRHNGKTRHEQINRASHSTARARISHLFSGTSFTLIGFVRLSTGTIASSSSILLFLSAPVLVDPY